MITIVPNLSDARTGKQELDFFRPNCHTDIRTDKQACYQNWDNDAEAKRLANELLQVVRDIFAKQQVHTTAVIIAYYDKSKEMYKMQRPSSCGGI